MSTELPPASLLATILEDRRTHWGSWNRPGAPTLAVHRLAHRVERSPRAGLVLRPVVAALEALVRRRSDIHLSRSARIGRRFRIGHQGGITIGEGVRVGDDCAIRQGVRIGAPPGRGPADAPRIGNRVSIGAGAVIEGPVVIGDGATIGPNAVVTADVPPGASAVAPMSRIRAPAAPSTRTHTPGGTAS